MNIIAYQPERCRQHVYRRRLYSSRDYRVFLSEIIHLRSRQSQISEVHEALDTYVYDRAAAVGYESIAATE